MELKTINMIFDLILENRIAIGALMMWNIVLTGIVVYLGNRIKREGKE